MKGKFLTLESPYAPAGDQPRGIRELVEYINKGIKYITLLGITGSGKTFTIANVLAQVQRSALILSPNKTLASQLYNEFKSFFPESEVHFFISYYDYYRPEAYIPATDTYLEKEALINEEIDSLRHAATVALLEGNVSIIVASVSAIYGIGAPEDYVRSRLVLRVKDKVNREELLTTLTNQLLYKRATDDLSRGVFRLMGECLEVVPSHEKEKAYRFVFFGDQIESIQVIDSLTKARIKEVEEGVIYPASHFATPMDVIKQACKEIKEELFSRVAELKSQGKFLEAERLESRTLYDIALLEENGTCVGIENYSRYLSRRKAGEPPITLIDYFPKNFITIIDESHVSIPQLRGMYEGDRSRKQTLVDFGFRLPSALDNRPLKFEEFMSKIGQTIFVSATPGDFELEKSKPYIVELINRPTGITDPIVEVRPALGQVKDCLLEVQKEIQLGGKVLVLTTTKKLAEELAKHFRQKNIRARYLHSDLNAVERYEILMALNDDIIDVIIGINLLREGLDLVKVSLVCILDADKEGFLRSSKSLIQIIGRAARNLRGRAILYADKVTKAIKEAVNETNRRRQIQIRFNESRGIKPQPVKSKDLVNFFRSSDEHHITLDREYNLNRIKELEEQMLKAAKEYRFEEALKLRDELTRLKSKLIHETS